MENAHQRKKEPEVIRQKILDSAIQLAADNGVTGVSIQAVADLVGVTKGGVFHHFKNKQILLEAMLVEAFDRLNFEIDQYMENDPVAYGRFTRAYIEFTLKKPSKDGSNLWSALSFTMLSNPTFNQYWIEWLENRLEHFKDTDGHQDLNILRYAADGIWLTYFTGIDNPEKTQQIVKELVQRTYPK
jgi:AcrR family transcriptional regulator